jgi:hypothetical protein
VVDRGRATSHGGAGARTVVDTDRSPQLLQRERRLIPPPVIAAPRPRADSDESRRLCRPALPRAAGERHGGFAHTAALEFFQQRVAKELHAGWTQPSRVRLRRPAATGSAAGVTGRRLARRT